MTRPLFLNQECLPPASKWGQLLFEGGLYLRQYDTCKTDLELTSFYQQQSHFHFLLCKDFIHNTPYHELPSLSQNLANTITCIILTKNANFAGHFAHALSKYTQTYTCNIIKTHYFILLCINKLLKITFCTLHVLEYVKSKVLVMTVTFTKRQVYWSIWRKKAFLLAKKLALGILLRSKQSLL